ncbi:MAG: DUF2752 domain-containing protein [Actinomycetes bacterium]
MTQAAERERSVDAASAARSRGVQRWIPAGIGAGALAVLFVRDPNQSGSYGFCPLHSLTGLDCPFCGGLRGTHALLHGDVATALDHNLLLPLYLGVLVTVGVMAFRPSGVGGLSDLRNGRGRLVMWGLVAVTLAFFVIRNLPWFPYLDAQA